MTTLDGGLAEKTLEALIEPVVDLAKKVLGPLAEETGALLGTEVRVRELD